MPPLAAAPRRRLPGFAFRDVVTVADDVPRMDVAVVAGFAASGPVNVPVPVSDPAHFAAVFGGDAPLAWDVEEGRTIHAHLAPAVRAFFANGGRRCWVVRLAGEAESSVFPVPGVALLAAPAERGSSPSLVADHGPAMPLELLARSPGRWADDVRVSASLTSARAGVSAWHSSRAELVLPSPAAAPFSVGELLHIAWPADGLEAWTGVSSAAVHEARTAGELRVLLRGAAWLERANAFEAGSGTARLPSGEVDAWLRTTAVETGSPPPGGVSEPDERITLALAVAPEHAPAEGTVIVANLDGRELVIVVGELVHFEPSGAAVSSPQGPSSPPMTGVVVRGHGWWRLARHEIVSPFSPPVVRRVGLDLWARAGSGAMTRVGDLGLAPGHSRHIARLPDDASVHARDAALDRGVWADVLEPRCPLAGPGVEALCLPLGVTALPERFLRARHSGRSALERDGLHELDATLFADAALADSLATTLLADAEYHRFLAPRPDDAAPAELTGLHAALGIEEASLIAIPDAVHAGWDRAEWAEPVAERGPAEVPIERCARGDFADCAAREPEPAPHDVADESVRSIVLERLPSGEAWRVRSRDRYTSDVLVAVHRLALRVCAARRDVMAVLSLPEHYDENDALAHARLLGSPTAAIAPFGSTLGVLPLTTGEADASSFAALYHGWTFVRDERGVLRSLPPDGAACGIIARRANERGAWVAPANEPLRGVVALRRPVPSGRWLELLEGSVNLVRQDARGASLMSADTLARDPELRAIGVRRLLILLRRLAVQRGARYAFEPNDETFRRLVQRGFETTLGEMFQRGAFAGSTAATAFQVVTDETVNTAAAMEAGRFIVELRVAPSRPLVFLTIRLVRTGDRVAVSGP